MSRDYHFVFQKQNSLSPKLMTIEEFVLFLEICLFPINYFFGIVIERNAPSRLLFFLIERVGEIGVCFVKRQ